MTWLWAGDVTTSSLSCASTEACDFRWLFGRIHSTGVAAHSAHRHAVRFKFKLLHQEGSGPAILPLEGLRAWNSAPDAPPATRKLSKALPLGHPRPLPPLQQASTGCEEGWTACLQPASSRLQVHQGSQATVSVEGQTELDVACTQEQLAFCFGLNYRWSGTA